MKKLANDCLVFSIGLLISFAALIYGEFGGSSLGSYFVYFGFAVVLITALVYYFRVYKTIKSDQKVPQKVKSDALYCCFYLVLSAICILIGYFMPGEASEGFTWKGYFFTFGVTLDLVTCITIFWRNYLPLKKIA